MMPDSACRSSKGTSCPLITQDQTHEVITARRKAQLKMVQSDLQKFSAQMQEALARQEDLLGLIALHESYIAPIRKVPSEVLGIIFFEFVEIAPLYERYLLALVSRRWRDVLHSTPSAWRRIFFSWEDRMPKMEAIRLHVARAGTIPLVIHVGVALVAGSGCLEADIRDWYALVQELSWSSFTLTSAIKLASLDGLEPFLSQGLSNNCNVAMLRACHLSISHEGPPSPFSNVLHEARRLRSLEIPGLLLLSSNPAFKTLRTLTIGADYRGDQYPTFISILPRCSLLESLSLEVGITASFKALGSEFILPHLLHLHVSEVDAYSSQLFRIIGTPKLESLEISHFTYISQAQLTEDFVDFISHPFPISPLKKLVFRWTEVEDDRLTWFLHHLPELEEMIIERSKTTTGRLLEALAEEAPRFCCSSDLKSIEIIDCPKATSSMFETLIHTRVRDLPLEIPGQGKNPRMFPPVPLSSVLLDGVDMIKMFNQ